VLAERGLILEIVRQVKVTPERFVSSAMFRVNNHPINAGWVVLCCGKPGTHGYMVIARLFVCQTCQVIVRLFRVGGQMPKFPFLLRYVPDRVGPL